MSETTLTTDDIQAIRARDTCHTAMITPAVPVTPAERDALCAAAERAETLEAEVAKWNKCDSLVCPYEQRAMQAEAQLTEVTRERQRLIDAVTEDRAQTITAEMERLARASDVAGAKRLVENLLMILGLSHEKSQRLDKAFLAKWEQVKPAIDGAFVMGHVHGARYTGPTIGEEIEAMRRALPADPSAPTPR